MARLITKLACKAMLRSRSATSTLFVNKPSKACTKVEVSRVFARSTISAHVKPFGRSLQVRYFSNNLEGGVDNPDAKSLDSEVKKVDGNFFILFAWS
jgi:hypothetical protein